MQSEQQILQRNLVQFLVKDVFHTIGEEDILKYENGLWMHKGQPLTSGQIDVLRKEAINLQKSSLYSILISELIYHYEISLKKAQTENDIISAKLLRYFVDVLATKIKKLAELVSPKTLN